MRYLPFLLILLPIVSMAAPTASTAHHPIAIVIHGGAGTISRKDMTPVQDKAYRAALKQALEAGYAVLKQGGKSLDAVQAAIRVMEDDPLFNAGKGAVFDHEGKNELDAAIMDGSTLKAGAVAAVQHIKNPIDLARLVMDKTPHVLLIGAGAEEFAKSQGMALVPQSYFFTQHRWDELQKALKQEQAGKGGSGKEDYPGSSGHGYGTVGAVAVDRDGDVAAGTSTGGTTAKQWGRVGDSPLIGAGTYASNAACAVSATGAGEFFIRLGVAKEICALVQHKGLSLQAACDQVVQTELAGIGGDGGVIAVAPDGAMAWSFNTSGMYRARISDREPLVVGIYKDDP